MSRAHHHELDKRGKHPAREEPGKHGEIRGNGMIAMITEAIPIIRRKTPKRYVSAEGMKPAPRAG